MVARTRPPLVEDPRRAPRRHRRDIGTDDAGHVEHDGDPDSDVEPPASALARLGWFALLWLGGVGTVTAVGLAIRAAIMP